MNGILQSYPSDDGKPKWSTDHNERLAFDPIFDILGLHPKAIQNFSTLDDSSQHMTPLTTIRANQHVLRTNKHVLTNDTTDYENLRPYFG